MPLLGLPFARPETDLCAQVKALLMSPPPPTLISLQTGIAENGQEQMCVGPAGQGHTPARPLSHPRLWLSASPHDTHLASRGPFNTGSLLPSDRLDCTVGEESGHRIHFRRPPGDSDLRTGLGTLV